jgi:hypothetical protein
MRPTVKRICCMIGGLVIAVPVYAQSLKIPDPLKAGHQELYTRLEAAGEAGGETGEAAQAALQGLRGHFEKEESYALPQLGALPALVGMPGHEGEDLSAEQKQELIARTERFREELPTMLEEHEEISAALDDLRSKARSEGNEDIARLASEVMTHARTEELVLYPAALLIGDHLAATSRGEQ